MTMWDTVLFDLDGTLTDSGEGITRCVEYALMKEFGIEVKDRSSLRIFIGPPLKEQFMSYAGLSEEEAERAVRAYRERYAETGIYENRLYGGIADLLKRLSAIGMRIGLASSKPTVYCERILTHFGIRRYFSTVVGSEMDGSRTKKSEVVAEALMRLHAEGIRERQRVVLAGDRSYDIRGAREAGIASIGVTFGFGTRSELEEASPDVIVDSPQELLNVLSGQFLSGRAGGDAAVSTPERTAEHASARPLYPFDGGTFMRLFRMAVPVLIGIALNFGLSALFVFVLALFRQSMDMEMLAQASMRYALLVTGVMDILYIISMALLLGYDERQRSAWHAEERLLKKLPFGPGEVLMTMEYMLAVSFAADLIMSFIQTDRAAYSEIMNSFTAWPVPVTLLIVGFIGPIGEEFLFRGVLYRRIRDYLGLWPAALISAAIFGAVHGTFTQGVPAALMGVVLAVIYEHFGTLKASIAAHIAVNVFAVLTMALPSSSLSTMLMTALVIVLIIGGVISAVQIFRPENQVNQI